MVAGRDGRGGHQRKEHAIGIRRNGAEAHCMEVVWPLAQSGFTTKVAAEWPPARMRSAAAPAPQSPETARGEQAGQPVEERFLAVSHRASENPCGRRFAGGQNQSRDH